MLRILLTVTILTLATTPGVADSESPQFETHIRSILKKHCFHCHGEEPELQGGLDLRLVHLMKTGGDSGAAIEPGQPDDSLLLQRVLDGDMPPEEGKQLSAEETELLRRWIQAGATTLRPEPESVDDLPEFTEEEMAHWAFQPVQKPDVPNVQHQELVSSPVDAFLLAQLEQQNFVFQDVAPRRTLIRRLALTMHGLPPSPEEVTEFEQQDQPDAWQQLIDRYLASSHYGERWAQHWLDVAGYADSEGYNDADAERPNAWRFRDYVIRSFNNDKPFDQFIHEQLAGDELLESPLNNLEPADVERLTATGFLRMAPDGTGGSVPDAEIARNETIADTVRIVSSSLMGLTVGCAQCHSHRYDPISQQDYYRFRAIFDPALNWKQWKKPAQRRVSLYRDEDRKAAAEVEKEAKLIDAERTKKQTEFIAATFEKQLKDLPAELHDKAREAHSTAAGKRNDEQKALFKRYPQLNVTPGSLYLYDRKAADKLKEMAEQAKQIRAKKPAEGFVRALTEPSAAPPESHWFFRGDHQQPKDVVPPAGLTVVSATANPGDIPVKAEDHPGSGRRLALARRLTSPQHPLTARVIVNRIWLHHFGRGLVSTPTDFGALGTPPTHPELLDWLAAEFVESGWSIKHLHRLILTSTAWQQQAASSPELQTADPENNLYGRAELQRLDAEALRDAILAVSGKLNPKAFGPPVPVMADQVGRIVIGQQNYKGETPGKHIDMKGEQYRRSVYVQVRRSRPLSVLKTFDRPEMAPNCDMRRPSTGSPQSLMMLNSDLVLEFSRDLAKRLQEDAGDTAEAQIERLWRLAYSRPPEAHESSAAAEFVTEQTAVFAELPDYQPKDKKPPTRTADTEAMALLCQMLLSSNEFMYVD